MDDIVEILLCDGGDVELCAQISKHIIVFAFAFDPLSITLSLSLLYCALHHIHIIYMLSIVCVPRLC